LRGKRIRGRGKEDGKRERRSQHTCGHTCAHITCSHSHVFVGTGNSAVDADKDVDIETTVMLAGAGNSTGQGWNPIMQSISWIGRPKGNAMLKSKSLTAKTEVSGARRSERWRGRGGGTP
jgi:hypothetical protein